MSSPSSNAATATGLMRTESSAESCFAVGTRYQLVASGIVSRATFPKGRVQSAREVDKQGNFWMLFLESKGQWCLHVERSASEVAAYREAQKCKLNAVSRQRFLHAGAEQWRTLLVANLQSTLAAVRTLMEGQGGQGTDAFRCSQQDINAFDALACRMSLLMGNAQVPATHDFNLDGAVAVHGEPHVIRPRLRVVN